MKQLPTLGVFALLTALAVVAGAEAVPTGAELDTEQPAAATPVPGEIPTVLQEAQSQGEDGREKLLDLVVANLGAKLTLTDSQAEAVRPILSEQLTEMAKLQGEYAGQGLRAMRKMRRDAKRIRENQDRKMARVLSSEQMKQYQEMRDEIRKELRGYAMAHKDELLEWQAQQKSASGRGVDIP